MVLCFQTALCYAEQYGVDRVRVMTLAKNRGKGGAVRRVSTLTLKVLVMTIDALGHWIITAQWEGMGDVGSARYVSTVSLN